MAEFLRARYAERGEEFGCEGFGEQVLLYLSAEFADHPDYRAEWRVELDRMLAELDDD